MFSGFGRDREGLLDICMAHDGDRTRLNISGWWRKGGLACDRRRGQSGIVTRRGSVVES